MIHSLLLLSLVAAAGDAPRLARGADQWVLANSHVRCVLNVRQGGLPALISDSQGRVYWRDARLYSDRGLFPVSVSSVNCREPRMAFEQKTDAITVTASGTLLPAQGEASRDPIGYRVTYTLGTGKTLGVRVELSTPVERPEAGGFLALVTGVPEAREWSARTLNGLVAESFGTRRDRVWQSGEEALDPDRPEIGASWGDGRRLLVDRLRSVGPLETVFWLQGDPGQVYLFLAFLGGTRAHPWRPDAPWETEFSIHVE